MMYIFAPAAALVAAALITAGLIRSSWERSQLETESYTVHSAGVPEPVRAAFICDIHDRLDDGGIESICSLVRSASPDVILLGGDIFTCKKNETTEPDTVPAAELVKKLAESAPVFYAEGNHELRYRLNFPDAFMNFLRRLEESGCLYLRDSHVIYKGIAFHAVSLGEEYFKRAVPLTGTVCTMPVDYLIKRLGIPEKDRLNILMMHSPMYLKQAHDWGADLVLSGHFHGGTVRIPHIGGLMTPQFQFFVKECSGVHMYGDTTMIVSRGIGTHSVRLRLNDIPEISIIDIGKRNSSAHALRQCVSEIGSCGGET